MVKPVSTHADGSECPEGKRRVPRGHKPCCEEFEQRTYACYYDIRYEWWPRLKNWVIVIPPEAGGGGIAFGFCPHCGFRLTPRTEHGRFLDVHG